MAPEKTCTWCSFSGKKANGGIMTRPVAIDTITERMKEFGAVEQVRKNRVRIKTVPDKLHDAILTSQAVLGFDRLITISTVDNGETFELLYHLIGPHLSLIHISEPTRQAEISY